MEFVANQAEDIDLKSDLVRGALKLAKSNGEAEAVIVNKDNRRTIIKTVKHPEEVKSTASDEDQIKYTIFEYIMNKFRNGWSRQQS